MKNIPLGKFRVNFGGDLRTSEEWMVDTDFGQGTNNSDGYFLFRYHLHMDLNGPSNVRLFGQLKYSAIASKEGPLSPTDRDEGDINQLFIDKVWSLAADEVLMARLGRQETILGSGLLVGVREGPNSRLSFDSFKLHWGHHKENSWELFAGRPVNIIDWGFDNETSSDIFTTSLYGNSLWKTPNYQADAYIVYYKNDDNVFQGDPGKEERSTFGTRFKTFLPEFVSETDAMIQTGRFNGKDIWAYGIASQMRTPLVESLDGNLQISYFSGDNDAGDDQLNTFNALFPKGQYYGFAAEIGHPNLIAVQPGVLWKIQSNFKWLNQIGFFWRQSLDDGVYKGNGILLRSANGSTDSEIASQYNTLVEWRVNPQLALILEYNHLFPGSFIRDTGPSENVSFTALRAYMHF